MISLYVKTHNKTGLKYLGKTEQDPFKYKGSGVYWNRHLKVHGNDVTTEIIKECVDNNEVKQWGSHFSDLWNIVESSEWANMKPETGDGAPSGEYHHQSYNNPNYDSKNHSNYGKSHKESTIEKNRQANSGENNPQYGTRWINNGVISKKIKDGIIPFGWQEGRLTNFGKYDKSSTKNPNYDSKVRMFEHKNGDVVTATQSEMISMYGLRASSVSSLIKGNLKSTSGWSIKNV